MPADKQRSVERSGRLLWILRYLLLDAYIFYALQKTVARYPSVGFILNHSILSLLSGATLGILFTLIRIYGASWRPGLRLANAWQPEASGPISIWLTIILVGGFSEELWRAFCIVAIQNDGKNPQFAVLLTSAVFAISQLSGRPSRITSNRDEIFFTALIGVALGTLFLATGSLVSVVTANIVYQVSLLYVLRNGRPNDLTST